MEGYGYVLILFAFGSFIIGLISLIVQIIMAINKKK
ncbi:putative holin-like toxin [Aquisalibacillus elongatus]|uniref:Putative holin-like toxin n=1 Tax=Aquisalibacillus elongatus TaxID=485577 RepID=A0A3N5C9D0_9BACI|nr:putative holin-like toxin [Aquisalibacillus elongatus]